LKGKKRPMEGFRAFLGRVGGKGEGGSTVGPTEVGIGQEKRPLLWTGKRYGRSAEKKQGIQSEKTPSDSTYSVGNPYSGKGHFHRQPNPEKGSKRRRGQPIARGNITGSKRAFGADSSEAIMKKKKTKLQEKEKYNGEKN